MAVKKTKGAGETAPSKAVHTKMVISNPTTTRRGIMLPKGVVYLEPGEIRQIPIEEQDDFRKLFAAKSFQQIVDAGLLRVTDDKIEELVEQETPAPPEELTNPVQVEGTGLAVGANAEREYAPKSSKKMKAAGSTTL